MDFSLEEITFGLLELESSLFKLLEDNLNVFEMLLLISAENDDVIKIHHHKLLQSCKTMKLIVESMQVLVLTQEELH